MPTESIELKTARFQDSSPLVGRIRHWFRARPQENKEDIPNVSPQHAQTEDTAAKFWSVYISEAERYDSALVESWKADMEGMLIFSGLFSASLTAFIIESYKNLKPDTGDMTVALLTQVSQQLSAQLNGSQAPTPSPAPFKVQASSLVCNGFWFVSLGLSLTCALLATLVEQWAREFLHKTEIRPSPVRRARVFSFLYYGISRFGIHAIVDIIPLLLHSGLVLFFAGLAAFLLPINPVMTTIVSAILAAFLVFYTVITILPVVALDCPYRTPLSGIFWRFVQYLAIFLHLPSSNRSLTDAVLGAAMQRRDIRDERAVLWTLESLTDNTELLPFVEAVPDIIYGPTGFRRVDDHLFRLVLQTADAHTSLPSRILALLWSAETLPVDDPLRTKRQIEALRALWALAIVASRISSEPTRTVYGIDHAALVPLSIPRAYSFTLAAVIEYTHLKNIQERFKEIGTLLSRGAISTPRERKRMIRSLRAAVPGLDGDVKQRELRAPEIASALQTLLQISNSNPDDRNSYDNLTVARHVVSDLNGDSVWQFLYAQNVVALLSGSFHTGLAPYRLLATCEEILPDALITPNHLHSLFGGQVRYFSPSFHSLVLGESLNDLDIIMRCSLRILPLLAPSHFASTIHWYLSNRMGGMAFLDYAFADCNWDTLVSYLLEDMCGPAGISNDTLAGITTLCLWRQHAFSTIFTGGLLDYQRLLSVIEGNPQWRSSPTYPTAKAVLTSSILSLLESSIWQHVNECVPEYAGQPISQKLQEFAEHPVFRGTCKQQEGAEPLSMLETLERMSSEISDQYGAVVALFLSVCADPVQRPYKAQAAVTHLCSEWPAWSTRAMSARQQLELAQAALHLVECACDKDNPHGAEVEPVIRALWEDLEDAEEVFGDPPSAAVIAQARALYRDTNPDFQPLAGPAWAM
ncbi:hypothetical protein FB451DRAFT_1086057 [Mycena latifolia]|nr:hypothetical protein FB451DRAFT_1086057 [Mycena latifolia]